MSSLNELQNLRSYLVEKVNYDVEKAKKVWDFIMDYKEINPLIRRTNTFCLVVFQCMSRYLITTTETNVLVLA